MFIPLFALVRAPIIKGTRIIPTLPVHRIMSCAHPRTGSESLAIINRQRTQTALACRLRERMGRENLVLVNLFDKLHREAISPVAGQCGEIPLG